MRRPGAQVRSYLREHLKGEWDWRLELRVMRRVHLPRLPRGRRREDVWAVGVVRDEVDVIGDSIRHLLDQGVDRVLVANHMSTDGTGELLAELSRRDSRVLVARDTEPGHFQMEKVTWLSQAAWWAGARWVVPFDADEFWFAERGSVAEFLRPHSASIIRAQTTNMLPVAGQGPLRSGTFLMDPSPGDEKVAFRAHPAVLVGPGNHGVCRVGPIARGLHIAHLPYRGSAQMARKYRVGAQALDAARAPQDQGWHWRRGSTMSDREIDEAWQTMLAGGAVPEIGWQARGSLVKANPLTWATWDPDGVLSRGEAR
jgi:hypothetical protein